MRTVNSRFTLIVLCLALAAGWAWGASSDPSALDLARRLNNAFIEVAETVSPSVVVIRVAYKPGTHHHDEEEETAEPAPRKPRRAPETPRPPARPAPTAPDETPASPEPVFDGQGSGVVIRDDGYILTNFHVVEDAVRIKVRFKDGRVFDAPIRGTDPQSDLAVIKIAAKGLPVAKLGNSDAARVGEFAIAIGAPFELENSVTFGHVSAKGRSDIIPPEDEESSGVSMDQDFIQTDASINPGNSGGPLVNISGEVIGINTLIHGLHTGIGFAIPSNLAREVADKLIADGKFPRPWLGIGIRSLIDDEDYHSLLSGVDKGVVVTSLQQDGPAWKSELKAGDIITGVEGKPVALLAQLRAEVRGKKIGTPMTLDVLRPDAAFRVKEIKIRITPQTWPEPTKSDKEETPPADNTLGLGLTVETLTKALAVEYEVDVRPGVIVTAVHKDGVADRKGFQTGDVITEVNLKPAANYRQFKEALKAADLKKGVMLHLVGEGATRFEVLRKEAE